MPYPESCPECGGAFRNTGSHYTARRNEIGRHVLLELGCQNTLRRYWWDFTSGQAAEDSATPARREALAAAGALSTNGSHHATSNGVASGAAAFELQQVLQSDSVHGGLELVESLAQAAGEPESELVSDLQVEPDRSVDSTNTESVIVPPTAPASLKEAFVRQLQLDRLTLRQMRSWLMSEEARKSIEVAAGATEATYERLALILFGVDLPHLLGKQATQPAEPGMTAEERLELQREKARIRARLRRAAAKAARQQS